MAQTLMVELKSNNEAMIDVLIENTSGLFVVEVDDVRRAVEYEVDGSSMCFEVFVSDRCSRKSMSLLGSHIKKMMTGVCEVTIRH